MAAKIAEAMNARPRMKVERKGKGRAEKVPQRQCPRESALT